MYGNKTFDANAAFSGGGFMNPSQTTQTADTSFTPAKNRETQGLLPLTVKQISGASQPSTDKINFVIDGVDVYNVKLVGLLFQKDERMANQATFALDDGTGRIDCIKWLNDGVDIKEMQLLSDGMYVKVHGHLKMVFQEKRVVVYAVRRVIDYDEIANHFADCMYVHVYNTKKQKMKDTPQVTGQMSNAAVRTPSKVYQPTSSNNFSAQHCMDDEVQGVNKAILDFLRQPIFLNNQAGAHRAEIAKQLNLSEQEIQEAIRSLEGEGLIYATIDEFHFKSSANG